MLEHVPDMVADVLTQDAEEAAKAKTSALILAAALFFAQPLSLAGYYTMQGFGYGKVNAVGLPAPVKAPLRSLTI